MRGTGDAVFEMQRGLLAHRLDVVDMAAVQVLLREAPPTRDSEIEPVIDSLLRNTSARLSPLALNHSAVYSTPFLRR